jgi:hypothetical protein
VDGLASEIREILLAVPNTPYQDCPDGLTPEGIR